MASSGLGAVVAGLLLPLLQHLSRRPERTGGDTHWQLQHMRCCAHHRLFVCRTHLLPPHHVPGPWPGPEEERLREWRPHERLGVREGNLMTRSKSRLSWTTVNECYNRGA